MSADRVHLNLGVRAGVAVVAALLVIAGCGGTAGSAVSSSPTGAAASPRSTAAGSAAVTSDLPGDCDGFPASVTEAIAATLGGTATLDADSSSADAASLDCIWRNTDTGTGSMRIQIPRDPSSAFEFLVASQEAAGTKDFEEVSGFDDARLYGANSFIAQTGAVALWIQTEGLYPNPTSEQLTAVAHAIVD